MIDKQFIITPDEWTESELNTPADEPTEWPEEPGDEQCASLIERAEHALLVKPQGHCVRVPHPDGSVWDV